MISTSRVLLFLSVSRIASKSKKVLLYKMIHTQKCSTHSALKLKSLNDKVDNMLKMEKETIREKLESQV